MTLFIAICDDEKRISADLENILIDILYRLNVKYEIDIYFSGEELCKKMESGSHYNLIFLDIEFAQNDLSGVAVGRLIRDVYNNNMVSIIYMSWEMKYSMQLFSVRPFDFLIKPLNHGVVEEAVKKYVKIAEIGVKDFTYKKGHDIYKVPVKDIVYLQGVKRKIILHLISGRKEEFYGTMKDLYEEQLQRYDFIYIHASFMVNYDFVAEAKYDHMILSHGKILPISQPKRVDVRKTFHDILKKRGV